MIDQDIDMHHIPHYQSIFTVNCSHSFLPVLQRCCLQIPQEHLLECLYPQAGDKQTHTFTREGTHTDREYTVSWINGNCLQHASGAIFHYGGIILLFSTYTPLTLNCQPQVLDTRGRVCFWTKDIYFISKNVLVSTATCVFNFSINSYDINVIILPII